MHRSMKFAGMIFILAALVLSACGILGGNPTPTEDPYARYTAAAQTVGVEFTRESALTPSATVTPTITATETPLPTTAVPTATIPTSTQSPAPTATRATIPDKAELFSQSISDGAKFVPGQPIKMTWVIRNIGSTTWTSAYSIRFYAGDLMGAPASVAIITAIKPGEKLEVVIDFITPDAAGPKSSIWVLQNPDGVNFYPFNLDIEVVAGTISPATPSP
jgi:hypothetical protein